MLSDPLSLTYDSSSKTLPRAAGVTSGVKRVKEQNTYVTSDTEFQVTVTQSELGNGGTRAEILLTRVAPDPDGPFTGSYDRYPNSVGLVFEVNNLRYNTNTDIPKLRTALLAFVDSTLQGRLTSGES